MSRIRFNSTTPALWIDAAWDETILDALLRSGAPVPFYCRAGICGQCKSVLIDGMVEDVGAAPQLLTPDESRQGLVLLCRSRALSDCEVRPVQQITANELAPWPAACVVEACERVSATLLRVRFAAAADAQPFRFRAGQYTRFEHDVPDLVALPRVFLASPPGLLHVDAYLPSRADAGAMNARLAPGSVLRLAAPTGSASLRDGESEPLVVVAERAGIASARGMRAALATLPTAPPSAFFFIVGSEDGALERSIAEVADAIDTTAGPGAMSTVAASLRLELSADAACQALDATLAALRARSPGTKIRAYIKAGRELTKGARSVLLRHQVRPWDTHADPVEE